MANDSIPKIVHLSWVTKDFFDNQSPVVLNGVRNLVDMNPDWEVTVSDDSEVDHYLKENLTITDYALLESKKIVEKTDVWRLIKLFKEGGLYIDIDRFYNIPLSDIIEDGIKCVLPTYLDMDFSQDIMLSAPGNPIYKEALELNLERRRQGVSHIYLLGPQTYMHAVTKILVGQMINSDPGVEVFNRLREEIKKMPFMKTYREDPPNDTFVYKHDPATFKPGNGKDKHEFYKECGVRHWTEKE